MEIVEEILDSKRSNYKLTPGMLVYRTNVSDCISTNGNR